MSKEGFSCRFFRNRGRIHMDNTERKQIKEYYTIDLLHIVKTLWKHVWIIALATLIGAATGFAYASFFIAPKYSSSILLYVNNNSFSLGNTDFSISSSQISAAQSLVKTYTVILDNRTTYERVIQNSGVSYTPTQLSKMVKASSANGTEIMEVKVTSTDPYEAALIANCIAEVLPCRISEIIDGASMEVVDTAEPNLKKISPSITKYALIGLMIGMMGAAAVLTVVALLDDTIHDEEYILQNYKYPVLAKLPDLFGSGSGRYGYRHYRSDKNYGYYRHRDGSSDRKSGN